MTIDDIIVTPIDIISHPKGDILHGIKKDDKGFCGFGEAYFSLINSGQIKGWNRHKEMTLNLIVPIGNVTFVIFDDYMDEQNKIPFKITLSKNNYKRLTVPPGLWLAFKGNGDTSSLILNIASLQHDSTEIDRVKIAKFHHDWG